MNAHMAETFRAGLGEYVAKVEAVQADLLALYRRKRVALATADADALNVLGPAERAAAERLEALVAERAQMLARATQFGLAGGTLAEVARAVGGSAASLTDRIDVCRRRATALRREGWVHWVVARRGLAQTTALLDLIARRGDRAAGYGESSRGGALLDFSA